MTESTLIPEPPFGPDYTITSASLQAFRRSARGGLASLARAERQAYGAAVEAAVKAAQAASLRRAGETMPRPNCASRTHHNTGAAIDKAIREQHRAALLACPSQIRRARTPNEWRTLYEEAMADKRARLQAAQRKAA